jgi:competence protein ComEA
MWLEWVGAGRVVGSAVAILAVLAGAYWLVKPPPATTESNLPFASGAGTSSVNATAPSVSAPPPTTTGEIVVHVAGAVAASGVYRLASGARVIDAVQLAGGLAENAAPDSVNLAAALVDGQRVYVPRVGEVAPVLAGSDGAGPDSPATPVNLNSATADELDGLPGVGPATAAAIIAHREQHGPFSSADDLADVRGIGPAKVEALRGLVTV